MRNQWIQTASPQAAWLADLHPLADRPADLLAVVLDIIAAGERHEVMRFHEVPALEWQRGRDPSLATVIAERYRLVGALGERTLDAFGFTNATWAGRPGDALVGARLATFDQAGEVVEREVLDLAALAAVVPDEQPPAARVSRPPLTVFGHRIVLRGDPPALLRKPGWPGLTLRFMTFTDVWWPTVAGLPRGAEVDNQALAARHTPRLNAFLAAAAAAVTARGGRWTLDPMYGRRDPSSTSTAISPTAAS